MLFPVPLQVGWEWFLWPEKPDPALVAVVSLAHVLGSHLVQLGWLGCGVVSLLQRFTGSWRWSWQPGGQAPPGAAGSCLCLYHSCCYPVGQGKPMNESRVQRWKNSLPLTYRKEWQSPLAAGFRWQWENYCGRLSMHCARLLSSSHFLCLSGMLYSFSLHISLLYS